MPKSCVESITLVENRIKASSEYFRAACKAGPWVTDDILDQKLSKNFSKMAFLKAFTYWRIFRAKIF